jgi:Flp pilus assembly protein CpaB
LSARANAVAIAVALVAGLFAAFTVSHRERVIEGRYGPEIEVLTAIQAIPRGHRFDAADGDGLIGARSIPERFAPPDALRSVGDLTNGVAVADLAAGSHLTSRDLASNATGNGFKLRPGERAVTIGVHASPAGAALSPGSRVDVLASGIGGAPVTRLVLDGAEVLTADGGADGSAEREVTLRATADQAVLLVRADIFAREVRLLVH